MTYLFTASMDVTPDKESLFNEVYDTEHIPLLLKVPGVISVSRYVKLDFAMIMGGQTVQMKAEGEPKYSAVYEIESPEVLLSDAWAAAVDQGRWPEQVRPFTTNRRHVLRRKLDS
jgi:hypothetical protein